MSTSSRITVAVLAIAAAWAAPARATPFAPGTIDSISSATLSGSVLADVQRPFSIGFASGTLTGTLQDRVFKQADGSLVFGQIIHDLSGPAGSGISMIGRSSFLAPIVKVTYDPTSLGTLAPSMGERSADGFVMRELFGGLGIVPATPDMFNSAFVYVQSGQFACGVLESALFLTAYGPNGEFGAAKIDGFSPLAVPEPEAWLLMSAGLASVLGFTRRRAGSGAR